MSTIAIIILSIALGFCIGGLFTLYLYKNTYEYYTEIYDDDDPSEEDKKDDEPKM